MGYIIFTILAVIAVLYIISGMGIIAGACLFVLIVPGLLK
jgi:hypothetical protein